MSNRKLSKQEGLIVLAWELWLEEFGKQYPYIDFFSFKDVAAYRIKLRGSRGYVYYTDKKDFTIFLDTYKDCEYTLDLREFVRVIHPLVLEKHERVVEYNARPL